MDNTDYIQLPPVKRGADSNIVKMLWEYVQLPAEEQEKVKSQLAWADEAVKGSPGDRISVVGGEQTEDFNKAMKEVLADIILETSQFACWLHYQIYDRGMTVEKLLEAHPETGDLILVMAGVFKELKEEEPD